MRRIRFYAIIGVMLMSLSFGGCKSEKKYDQNRFKNVKHPIATIVVKDYGTMKVELYPDVAPDSVCNFVTLANSGFYDGLTFHRVIAGFMIQGGDPEGTGGPGYCIRGEFAQNGISNSISHEVGVLSMARRSYPYDSAGSQFFICTADATYLDGSYAAFGKTIEGLATALTIANVQTDSRDKPLTDVIIESIRVDTDGTDYSAYDKF